MLTQARLKELFHYCPESGLFTRLIATCNAVKVGDVAGKSNKNRYIQIRINGPLYYAHRLAWLYVYGEWPLDQMDHINGDRSDNRFVNLRDVTNQENSKNRMMPVNNVSGVMGVSWNNRDKKWHAQIKQNGIRVNLGYFDDWFNAVCIRKSSESKNNYHENHGRIC